MTELLRKLPMALSLLWASASSWGSAPTNNVPEPGSIGLVGIAVAAVIYVAIRKRK